MKSSVITYQTQVIHFILQRLETYVDTLSPSLIQILGCCHCCVTSVSCSHIVLFRAESQTFLSCELSGARHNGWLSTRDEDRPAQRPDTIGWLSVLFTTLIQRPTQRLVCENDRTNGREAKRGISSVRLR